MLNVYVHGDAGTCDPVQQCGSKTELYATEEENVSGSHTILVNTSPHCGLESFHVIC